MKATIVAASRQKSEVDRLVNHCRQLDGTELVVIPADESITEYPKRNNYALRQAAEVFKGEPFFWLEPDAIPTVPGWLKVMEDEYRKGGKPYMLSRSYNPPFDLVGGIGVYGPDTATEIPKDVLPAGEGWDTWMIQNIPHKIYYTKYIQHRYGIYDKRGDVIPHRFPRDERFLDDRAVVFHRDKYQDLIAKQPSPDGFPRVFHTGDLGDLIAFLPVARELGGVHLLVGGKCFQRTMRGPRLAAIRPLLEAQPYILSVTETDDVHDVEYDMTDWRSVYVDSRSLTESQGKYINLAPVDTSPWLHNVEPNPLYKGRVIVARSARYHTNSSVWRETVMEHRNDLVFVGTPQEHREFMIHTGSPLPYAETSNFMELASVIKAGKLFVGNQSSPFWVAAGLGVDIVQERWNFDSTLHRKNIIYR